MLPSRNRLLQARTGSVHPEPECVHVGGRNGIRQAPAPRGNFGGDDSRVPSRGSPGHIITIDVLQGARRSGVGSRLLTEAESRLLAARCDKVYLETAVDNRNALIFYKRHGYFLNNVVPGYYSNGVDALVLQKDLLSAAQAS
jgi:ribosomal protein S18 acetylase RimI-like enzyme